MKQYLLITQLLLLVSKFQVNADCYLDYEWGGAANAICTGTDLQSQPIPDSVKGLVITNITLFRITKDLFSRFNSTLKSLNCRGCQLDRGIDDNAFENFKQLELLNIVNSRLTRITAKTFAGIDTLKGIGLRDNEISIIDENSFIGLVRLERIELQNNRLTKVLANWFANTPALSAVYLSDNRIEEIEYNAFNSTQLKYLWLNGNKLTHVSSNWFGFSCPGLREIKLNQNQITSIDDTFLDCAYQLVYLDVTDNRLECINVNRISGAKNMKKIDIANNKLNSTCRSTLMIFSEQYRIEIVE